MEQKWHVPLPDFPGCHYLNTSVPANPSGADSKSANARSLREIR
jgi:hypothetical protein